MQPSSNLPPPKPYLSLSVIGLILLALLLCWSKLPDQVAEGLIHESMQQAKQIYASSQAINAAVSVAQSANLGVGVSVTVGELLDPINDLIERFSAVMEASITSMAAQKALMLGFSSNTFNFLLTIIGILLLISIHLNWRPKVFFRLFALFLILRISLVVVILANFAADQLFLKDGINIGQTRIGALQQEATAFAGTISDSKIERMPNILQRQSAAKAKQLALQQQLKKLNKEIDTLEQSISHAMQKRPWWDLSWWTKDPEILKLKAKLQTKEDAVENKENQLDTLAVEIDTLQDNLDCIAKRSQGEHCSWLEKWQKITSTFDFSVIQASYAMNKKIGDLLPLMALILLKAIFFPMLFGLLIYRLLNTIWTTEIHFST